VKRRRRGSIFWASMAIFFVAAGLAAVGGYRNLTHPVGGSARLLLSIEPGESVSEVAETLWQRGLIRSKTAFIGAAYATGKWRHIQAGRHDLDGSMAPLDVLDALCRGSRKAWRWLTIPEGYTLKQIAQAVQDQRLGSGDGFARAAGNPRQFPAEFPLGGNDLEGYLFPDTYRVDSGESEEDIITQMLRRFDQVVWRDLFDQQPTYKGRSLRDILILASLVEWEAQADGERAMIAGVLVNRLQRGQKLECDATVQYALGEGRKSRLMFGDLTVESDYNTYLHQGLPPGPICSPGVASIRAAMDPADTPYLYYVAQPDGTHVFSTTYAQHQAAIARVRRSGQGGRG
jgi:UPF0755 protein